LITGVGKDGNVKIKQGYPGGFAKDALWLKVI
jgi:hypothetical protein